MLFKSVASFSRSGTVAKNKNFWPASSTGPQNSQSGQTVPGFFVSTPHFKRQQSQIVAHNGDTRHSSKRHGNLSQKPYVVVSSGPNFSTTSAVQNLDEDREDYDSVADPNAKAGLRRLSPVSYPKIPKNIDVGSLGEGQHAPHLESQDTQENVQISSAQSEDALASDPLLSSSSESLQEAVESTLKSTTENIIALQKLSKHQQVLDLFALFEQTAVEFDIPVALYNRVLKSLAHLSLEASDISPLLQAYKQLLGRGILPSRDTYNIVVGTLIDLALKIHGQRQALRFILGPEGELEAVDEAYESLGCEDHFQLAAQILKASLVVDVENVDQEVLDKLLFAAVELGMQVDSSLVELGSEASAPAIIKLQTDAGAAEHLFKQFSQSSGTRAALVETLIKLGEPDRAIEVHTAFKDDEILESLVCSLASSGFVSTALKYISGADGVLSFDAKARTLAAMCAGEADHLPTASLLYERLAATKDASHSKDFATARSCYVQLCAQTLERLQKQSDTGVSGLRQEHVSAALRSVIKESQVRKATLTPSAVVAATRVLFIEDSHLALSFFAEQAQLLSSAWNDQNVDSFTGQEMLSLILELLPTMTFDAALQLVKVPFLTQSYESLRTVVQTIWSIHSVDPSFRGKAPEILNFLEHWVKSCERTSLGLRMPQDLLEGLKRFYPLILQNADIGADEEVNHLLGLTLNCRVSPAQAPSLNEAAAEQHVHLAIQYASVSRVTAMEHLRRAVALSKANSAPAFVSVIEACERGEKNSLTELYSMMESTRYEAEKASILQAFVRVAHISRSLAQRAFKHLKEIGCSPCSKGFEQLAVHGSIQVEELFECMKAAAVLPTEQFTSTVLRKISRTGDFKKVNEVFNYHQQFPHTKSVLPSMIAATAHVRQAQKALSLLKQYISESGSPQTEPFNAVMQMFVHAFKNREAALYVFKLLEEASEPNQLSFQLVMEAWLLHPLSLAKADEQLMRLKQADIPANNRHFTTLLHARGILQRDFNSAISFYSGLVKNKRVLPDQQIFKTLLQTFVENSRTADTPKVLEEMQRFKVPVSGDMLEMLQQSWATIDPARAEVLESFR